MRLPSHLPGRHRVQNKETDCSHLPAVYQEPQRQALVRHDRYAYVKTGGQEPIFPHSGLSSPCWQLYPCSGPK